MGKINILDQNTINQIAAGEVIDRPSSIVKELVENAIDAGANAVTIELKDGGLSLIRITDNGSGIDKEDVHNAFLPHATSKIKSAADLMNISSLGFRGEALSSIAAVCQVELISKPRTALTGYSFKIEGGKELELEDIGAPDGTTFLVKNIFFNTPARRKFLKSAQTEGLYILELAEHMALSAPNVAFKVIINGQNKLITSGNGKLKDVIYAIYGKEITNQLIPVNLKKPGLTMSGFIGKPQINKANRSFENFYVNGRYVKAKLIERAIEDAFKPYMMQHKHPFCVVFLDIPPELIDVNVHPNKMELRFGQEELLYNMIYDYLSELIRNRELINEAYLTEREKRVVPKVSSPVTEFATPKPDIRTEQTKSEPVKVEPVKVEPVKVEPVKVEPVKVEPVIASPVKAEPVKTDSIKVEPAKPALKPLVTPKSEEIKHEPQSEPKTEVVNNLLSAQQIADSLENITATKQTLFDDKLLSRAARSKHRLIGQLFKTYLLIEYEEKLYMIDQHAAHEKVLYERTMKRLADKQCLSQYLATPLMLHLTERQLQTLQTALPAFEKLGFELEEFGSNTYCCRAIPDNMLGLNQTELLYEMLDDLGGEYISKTPETILDKVATMSCKAAVKGNMSLTDQEANALIEELLGLDNPYFCPHGRPTIISMTKNEIEKKFKRII